MRTFRIVYRSILITVATLLGGLVLIKAQLLSKLSRDAGLRLRTRTLRCWAKFTTRVMGMKITARGIPPRPPFILVSNHLSYLDIILLYTQIDCVFVSKIEVETWPVMGYLTKMAGTIFVDRSSRRDIPRVNGLISRNINRHHGLVLFPESTSSSGAEVMPFKPSLLQYPAHHQRPVSYASISYRTPEGEPPAHLSVCWWGSMTFGNHFLGVLGMPKFYASLRFGTQTVLESDRKVLARKLWQLVQEQFDPVVTTEEACPTEKP